MVRRGETVLKNGLMRGAAFGLALGAWAMAGTVAFAQDSAKPAAAADSEDASAEEEVVVTGTRVVRNGYNAPTPTTVVTSETLQRRAPGNIADVLSTLPVFKASATTGTGGSGVAGNAGQSFVNLRGLGANRSLVLFNGERTVPSTAIGTVDVAIFPSLLMKRVDVVTGGASAAWGSDAVAGVVNLVLDTDYHGYKGEIQGGVSSRGDNRSGKIGLAAGGDLTDNFHYLLSGEYYQSEGVDPRQRPWTQSPSMDLIPNPAFVAGNGQPQFLLLPNVYYLATLGGVIVSGPLRGTQFGPGGTPAPYTFCEIVTSSQQACVTPRANQSSAPYVAFTAAPQIIGNVYGRLTYDLTDDLKIHADGLYGYSSTFVYSSEPSSLTQGFYTIQQDNAYLPASVRTAMTNAGITSFQLGRTSADIGPAVVRRKNTTQRYTIGIDGTVFGDWTLKAYYEYGKNRDDFRIDNNVVRANWTAAIDAVINPATGAVVCRSSLTSPANGCQPLNLFGVGSPSTSAIAYVMGSSQAQLIVEQQVAAFSLSGEPFETWAGPVSVAFGGEYREESAVQTVDSRSQQRLFVLGNPQPLSGKYNVAEGFVETVIPLARDTSWADSLDLNAAVRFTNYSTSGSVVTWKVGLTYEPTSEFKIRATRSRDIRAPNVLELFSGVAQTTAILIDPLTNTTAVTQSFTAGNPDLKPEEADTTAAGIVYTPDWAPGFSVSVDYYNIEVRDAISTLTFQDIINRCYQGSADLCGLITRNGAGVITNVTAPYLNLQSLKTSGVDIEASYRFDLDQLNSDWSGDLQLRLLASHIADYKQSDGVTTLDRTGSLFWAQPDWTWDLTGIYTDGPLSVMLNAQYISGGAYDNFYAGRINDNSVESNTVVNGNIQYTMDDTFANTATLYLSVSNIFDTPPPAEFHFGGSQIGNMNYDRVGRSFKLGLRFDY
ncbi:Vitamin B12 transporter BtuB [Alphaproteobacteria bacterium SO-S41]|nr:Vitamin B12 transporter BtuB [Alphaproteobacteria bacterium SO-S41]